MFRPIILAGALLAAPVLHAQTMQDVRTAYSANDKAEAIRLLTAMADKGDPKAMISLAGLYRRGDGTEKDFVRANALYRQAIEAGDKTGSYYLAFSYLNAQGVLYSSTRFHELISEAAGADISAAQYHLGLNLLTGRGTKQDEEAAMNLFRIAFYTGNILPAGKELADIYVRGDVVERDLDKAKEILNILTASDDKSMADFAQNRLEAIERFENGGKLSMILFRNVPFTEPRPGETLSAAQKRGRDAFNAAEDARERAEATAPSTPRANQDDLPPIAAVTLDDLPVTGPSSCAPDAPEHGIIVRARGAGFMIVYPAAIEASRGISLSGDNVRSVDLSLLMPRDTAKSLAKTVTSKVGTLRVRSADGTDLRAHWPFPFSNGMTKLAIGSDVSLSGQCPYRAEDALGLSTPACKEVAQEALDRLTDAIKGNLGPFTVELTADWHGEGEVLWSQPLFVLPWQTYQAAVAESANGVKGFFHMSACPK